ncbi:alpha/beta hydrolase [Limnovirga soli]|uniref:Uncharacterized protein n=1 Tax=Limnovirga soli TaxID=2656915 RepID=A0A8J8FFD7_9BACT|nr:hypothetical protein [Limnovirga soli]NNV57116.1 hypothetical protein [Limnovirga soli]
MLTSRKDFLKQTGFAIASTLMPFSPVFSKQDSQFPAIDTQHPKDCANDLRNPLYPLAYIKEANFTYHKGTYPGIIKDVLYKDEEMLACVDTSNLSTDICSATDLHYYGISNPDNDISILRYHVYYPLSTYEDSTNGHDYINYPLPCVAIFHPGGFQECPDYLQPGIKTVCQQLAMRGYIAITIDYRGGRILDTGDNTRTSVQRQLAPYRGMQDARGAIRSIIKRNSSNHGNLFTINEDQFFVGGQSAGAVIALGISYYRSQNMMNAVFPVVATSLNIQSALGHMNADYYYGESGTDLDNPTYWPVIRGVMNCWGGITIPKSVDGNDASDNSDFGTVEKTFFQAQSGTGNRINPPMIGFGGALDTTIPFYDRKYQDYINSSTAKYRTENFCLETSGNYKLKSPGTSPPYTVYIKLASAHNMYFILKELNRYSELYTDCNMGHGINSVATDNFGVNATTKDQVFTYLAVRTAVFFQTIMNISITGAFPPFGYTGKSFFVSYNDTDHITNQRICPECDPDHSCTFTNDSECP